MTRLSFIPDFHSSELQGLDVPIEVRAQDLTVVARTTASQGVTVSPGAYFVSATLPAGQELTGYVEVGTQASASVRLQAHQEDESPMESLEPSHYLNRPWSGPRDRAYDFVASPETFWNNLPWLSLTWLSGNIFKRTFHELTSQSFMPKEAQHIQVGQLEDAPAYVRIEQTGQSPRTLAVPTAGRSASTLLLTAQPDNRWAVDVHVANRSANLLLQYRAHGRAREAAETLESPELNAEGLLRGKLEDPIAATVGAYALLRFAALERLHDWTKNLFNWVPWLPDGAAVRGEHLARLGEHNAALHAFAALADRGLPMFTDGLSFALDRLRLYRAAGVEGLTAADSHQAASLLDQLTKIAARVDFSNPTVVIDGDLDELLEIKARTLAPLA